MAFWDPRPVASLRAPHNIAHTTMVLFKQPQERKPFFVGTFAETNSYFIDCPHCTSNQEVKFKEILMATWSNQERLAEPEFTLCTRIFGISTEGLGADKGLPGVVGHTCSRCPSRLFFQFNIRETADSRYSISLRAAASADPSTYSQYQIPQTAPAASAPEPAAAAPQPSIPTNGAMPTPPAPTTQSSTPPPLS